MESIKNIAIVCGECMDKMFPNKGQFDIKVGQSVKLKFTNISAEIGDEYMWVEVTRVDKKNDKYEGILDNDPIIIKDIKYGDGVIFKKEDVFDVLD